MASSGIAARWVPTRYPGVVLAPTPKPGIRSTLARRGMLFAAGLLGAVGAACVVAVVDDGGACGINAYFTSGQCYCLDGFGGDPDQGCDPIMTVWITDACDDGLPIQWRLFADEREWVWPEEGLVFETTGYLEDNYQDILCFEGERICFGGAAGERVWDLGLEGPQGPHSCDDCCFDCGAYEFDLGYLGCG